MLSPVGIVAEAGDITCKACRCLMHVDVSCAIHAAAVCRVLEAVHYPLVVSVEILELPLLLLLLSGLMWLFRLTPIELCVPVCKALGVETPLSLVLLCGSVVYEVEGVLLCNRSEARAGQKQGWHFGDTVQAS